MPNKTMRPTGNVASGDHAPSFAIEPGGVAQYLEGCIEDCRLYAERVRVHFYYRDAHLGRWTFYPSVTGRMGAGQLGGAEVGEGAFASVVAAGKSRFIPDLHAETEVQSKGVEKEKSGVYYCV